MGQGAWPVGGGEVGERLRGWRGSESALGAPADWPPALRAAAQLVLSSPAPMVLFWGERSHLVYNDSYAAIAGAKHPAILGMALDDAWPEIVDFHRTVLGTVRGGAPLSYRELPLVLHRSGQAEDVWLDIDYGPLIGESGSVAGVLAVVFDKTRTVEAMRARADAEELLRRREGELAQVQRIGRVGGLEVDLRGDFRNRRSPEYLAIHGLRPEDAHETHEDWVARIHPKDRTRVETHFRNAVIGSGHDYRAEYRIVRPSDGATRWIAAVARIERDENGRAVRLFGAHQDVTERKEAEAQQRLLAEELAHRVKNSMAMIQAIAAQTFRNAASLDEASRTFSARLAALARAHELLIGEGGASAALVDIVEGVIGVHGDRDRFTVGGPSLVLAPRAALALSLVLHELVTNAVKYGALSVLAGRVAVTWRIDALETEPQFRLRWQESAGPAATEPTRRGFGSKLIERSFQAMGGRGASMFLPSGLVFTLDCPLTALTADDRS